MTLPAPFRRNSPMPQTSPTLLASRPKQAFPKASPEGSALWPRSLAASLRRCSSRKGVELDVPFADPIDPAWGSSLAIASALRSYDEHKSKKSPAPPDLWIPGAPRPKAFARRVLSLAEHAWLACDMGDAPPNLLYPDSWARRLELLAEQAGCSFELLSEPDLERERMGCLLAVGRGSAPERGPLLVRIAHAPKGVRGKPVALVGKGITFDSGGLDLKTSDGMALMRYDMMGGAVAAAAVLWAAQSDLPLRVEAFIPMAENMPSGSAYRVGDILQSRKGLTVEVGNTDAEGRLVLADAIDFAAERLPKARCIVSVATLTGAIAAALGTHAAGLFSQDEPLARSLLLAGDSSGDPLWRMPLGPEFSEGLESRRADLRSTSSAPGAGASSAAAFLEAFAPQGLPFAHIDCSNVAKSKDAGATGRPFFALSRWLWSLAHSAS